MRTCESGVVVAVVLLALMLCVGGVSNCFAQGQAGEKGPAGTAKPDAAGLTIKGKIDYDKKLGGYFLMGEEPGGEFFIVNPDVKVLKQLKKRGKTVTVQAHPTRGAEYLFIEKIDGKPYRGKEPTSQK